jgi:hypothetical protein
MNLLVEAGENDKASPPLPYSEVMECGGVVFIRALTDGPYTRSRKKPIGGETHLEN